MIVIYAVIVTCTAGLRSVCAFLYLELEPDRSKLVYCYHWSLTAEMLVHALSLQFAAQHLTDVAYWNVTHQRSQATR